LEDVVGQQIRRSASTRANLYYGVCPRFDSRHYDDAWQIRTVRCLWSDVDDTGDADEAVQRCVDAEVPEPSAVVCTGRGCQLYWLLQDGLQLGDDEPQPVLTELAKGHAPKKYLRNGKGQLYLSARQNVPELSEQAIHTQDILAGIAARIGGDHTQDLSRLLRLPGSLNRKEERNGQEPVPARLVRLDGNLRYSVADFEEFAKQSPSRRRREQVAQMKLPTPKKLTPTKRDKLNELVAACTIAPIGARSEADWALACAAVERGWPKEDVWTAVESVGKFAEAGRGYFDRTWDRAEQHTQECAFVRIGAKQNAKTSGCGGASDHDDADRKKTTDRPAIAIRPDIQTTAAVMEMITTRMIEAGSFYSRAQQPVMVHGESLVTIDTPQQLAGVLNTICEFQLCDARSERFEPLPVRYATTWLNHPEQIRRLPEITLWTRNPVYTQSWRLVESGYNADTGIYYAGPVIAPRDGTTHLDRLLRDFCFSSPADRTNYLSLLLSCHLIPRFRESKPAGLFTGNQPGVGKTILAQIIAILRDAHTVETATYLRNDEEFEKRLGSLVRSGLTTLIIDNAKGRGKKAPLIESAVLERAITDRVLSFRLLGFSADIRVENAHMFLITANTPQVSRDLITRSIPIRLWWDGDPLKRIFGMADPESYAMEHRHELIGELLGMVERWKEAGMPLATAAHRFNKRGWAETLGGVLHEAGEPDFLANVDESSHAFDPQRLDVCELVLAMLNQPEHRWRAGELVNLAESTGVLQEDIGSGAPRTKALRLGVLLSKYIGEQFEYDAGKSAVLASEIERNAKLYWAQI
jgi:hypothetical protein